MPLDKPTDPVELIVYEALLQAGLVFYFGDTTQTKGLDFYIPGFDTYIECKQMPTDRVLDQMKRAENIIVIQGITAAETFATLIDLTT